MPELPEVEITARRLTRGLPARGSSRPSRPGIVALKTFDPPLDALVGASWTAFGGSARCWRVEAGELTLLIHLMSAGRLQLFDGRASLRDRASRVLVRLEDGRELRLREFGTQQRAWAKLLRSDRWPATTRSTAWPDAYPAPPVEVFERLLDQPRHLHPLLRDQRTIAGIGRSWVDELLWTARLSPFQKGSDLDEEQLDTLRGACDEVLGGALDHYEQVIGDTVPDKLPMPLQVHRRAGEDCPRCGTRIEAIRFKDYVMCYCPEEQTGGRVLKDRRLSSCSRERGTDSTGLRVAQPGG